MFVKYPKVKRLGDEDTDGILLGTVHVQEKIDGANASIWLDGDVLRCGSRTQDVSDKGFNGLVDFVRAHKGIVEYLAANPRHRLYGEWLVRHTIAYNETAYKQFYLFDILVEPEMYDVLLDGTEEQEAERLMMRQCKWLTTPEVYTVAAQYGIAAPELFGTFVDPMPDVLQPFVGKTVLGQKGEGICLKNPEFINKWGDRCVAKIVTQEFKEDNAITFGGNNKHSETYNEMYCVNEYMTLSRVRKIMDKLQPLIDTRLGREQTARIIQTAYHDMFVEEMWNIGKKFQEINFRHLEKLATRKAAKIYHDILDNHISVAYGSNDSSDAGASSLGQDNEGEGAPGVGAGEVEAN